MAASLLSDAATFALRVSFTRAMERHAPAFFLHASTAFLLHGPAAAPARHRLLHAAACVLIDTVIGVLHLAFGRAMQHQVPAFPIHGPAAAPGSSSALHAAVRVLIDTVSGLLVGTVIVDLHIAFGRAVQQQVPAALPASNVVLDVAVRVLIETASGVGVIVDLRIAFERAVQQYIPAVSIHDLTAAPASTNSVLLVDTVKVDLRIAVGRVTAAPASNDVLDAAGDPLMVVVVLAVLLLILFASRSGIALYLDRARATRGGEPRVAVLVFVPLFHLAVAVFPVAVAILAVVGGEEE
jgi:hypothetical protein